MDSFLNKELTILAIDDNQDNLITLRAVVSDAIPKARVITALDGTSGLNLALSENPDVILLDIVMPVLDGLEVCRKLKQDDRISHIPVIMLTALKTDRKTRVKALEAGAESFLAKPIDEVELIAQVKAMAKIKESADLQRLEKSHLASLVSERTLALEKELNEHRKTETELIFARDKAEESDRLKSAFLANMSHEIRTPMNGIIGFSELLKEQDLEVDERDRFVRIINDNCQQLLHIINDIIDISKIEAGLIELDTAEFSLNDLMGSLAENYLHNASVKGLQLIFNQDPGHGSSRVQMDQGKLRQVLDNLLTNAIKFTDAGRIEFGYNLRDNRLDFYVKDTGIGISEEHRKIIFNRFWQAEFGLVRKYGGNGLGLSIASAFVKKMGGEIHVESTPGLGSCFSFSLPYVQSGMKPAKQAQKSREVSDFTGRTILIVEDEPDNFDLLNIILGRLHLVILHAWNGDEAMRIFTEHPETALVLMDFKLPDVPGQEITKMMLKQRPKLPVIATTAYAMHGDMEKAMEAGCAGYLAKPIRMNDLLHILNSFLN